MGPHFKIGLHVLVTNIRLGNKWLKVTNTLALYTVSFIAKQRVLLCRPLKGAHI